MRFVRRTQRESRDQYSDSWFRQSPWIRFTVVLATISVVTYLVLRSSAEILLVNSSTATSDFAVLVELNCGHCYRTALERAISGKVAGVLLYAPEHRRLELLGAVPPVEENVRQKLLSDGVAPENIRFMMGISRSDWETARLVNAWLDEHPGKQIRVFCDRFSSSRWSYVLDRTLAEQRRSSVTIEGIRDARYDETNWWKCRVGLKSYFCSLFRIAYARMHGEDQMPDNDWSAEKYEARIVKW